MRLAFCAVLMIMVSASSGFAQQAKPDVDRDLTSLAEDLRSQVMVDPQAAYDRASNLEASLPVSSSDQNIVERRATYLWIKGEALNRLNKYDLAISVLDKALSLFPSESNSHLFPDLISSRATSARATGDYEGALKRYQKAHDLFLKSGRVRDVAVTLSRIGGEYIDARDYEKALHYYTMSIEKFRDDNLLLSYYNNVGRIYTESGKLDLAEDNIKSALSVAGSMGSDSLRVRILSNLSSIYLIQGRYSDAESAVAQAFDLSDKLGSYDWSPYLWGLRAKIEFEKGNLVDAQDNLERTFDGVSLGATPAPFRDFHEAAFKIYSRSGDFKSALEHLLAFKRLDDESRDISANANTALMGAQFDFANQELEISKLKTDTLEKEVQLARTRAQQRTIIFSAAILLVLVGVTGGSIHYRSVVRSRNEIRKKNDELSQSNLFLEKALKAKSEFLATTSHEIRTPLNGILGTTQVLIHSARMPEEVRERVELIQIAGEAMKGIVDDLLDVAKMESGTIEVAEECFNLQTALSEVSRFWSDSATNKGLTLSAELGSSPSFIMGDEKRLRQIVYNLLSNAVKFTDEGLVSLRADVDRDREGALIIEVSDTGCGIPEDELDRIFAPFHQVDGGKTRRHGGTGLGLSICQNLAVALGGTVSVSSRLGAGSTFVLRLPLRLAEEAGRNLAGAAGDTSSDLNLSRLLIVSDDAVVSASLQIPLAMRDVDFDLVDSMADAVSAMAIRPAAGLLVVASVLGADPGEAMERLMELRELSGEARLIVWLDEARLLTAPMVRLCGADDVLEGDFDPESALACVLNEPPVSTEYQGFGDRANGTMGF